MKLTETQKEQLTEAITKNCILPEIKNLTEFPCYKKVPMSINSIDDGEILLKEWLSFHSGDIDKDIKLIFKHLGQTIVNFLQEKYNV